MSILLVDTYLYVILKIAKSWLRRWLPYGWSFLQLSYAPPSLRYWSGLLLIRNRQRC